MPVQIEAHVIHEFGKCAVKIQSMINPENCQMELQERGSKRMHR